MKEIKEKIIKEKGRGEKGRRTKRGQEIIGEVRK